MREREKAKFISIRWDESSLAWVYQSLSLPSPGQFYSVRTTRWISLLPLSLCSTVNVSSLLSNSSLEDIPLYVRCIKWQPRQIESFLCPPIELDRYTTSTANDGRSVCDISLWGECLSWDYLRIFRFAHNWMSRVGLGIKWPFVLLKLEPSLIL